MEIKYQTKNYYEGIPPTGDNWTAPIKLGKFNNRIWWIASKDNYNGWIAMKIFSLEKKKSKANFWINHNLDRFAEGKDFFILIEHYPDLKNAIENYLFNN